MGLLVFGALFAVLFAAIALAQGIGHPDVPSGDVALVEDAPGDSGQISEAEFEKAFRRAALLAGEAKLPRPGSEGYAELTRSALSPLIHEAWLRGEAKERGISVTPPEAALALKQEKQKTFSSTAEYQRFLHQSHYSQADARRLAGLQLLSQRIEAQIAAASEPAKATEDLEAFAEDYEAKWSQRTFCASGYLTEGCSEFKGTGHPRNAPSACYEAHPVAGIEASACPAPVTQPEPALPGTVSPLLPMGTQLPQRPVPAGAQTTKPPKERQR
jgi:hypothetical protein